MRFFDNLVVAYFLVHHVLKNLLFKFCLAQIHNMINCHHSRNMAHNISVFVPDKISATSRYI